MTSSNFLIESQSSTERLTIGVVPIDQIESQLSPLRISLSELRRLYGDSSFSLPDKREEQPTNGTRMISTVASMWFPISERVGLKQATQHLLEEADFENWDGEGALALHQHTVDLAIRFIDLIPGDMPDPDVTATPHGEIDFDWAIGRHLMLTVSVGADSEIAFSGVFDGARLNGRELWTGAMPGFVTCCFQRLRGNLG